MTKKHIKQVVMNLDLSGNFTSGHMIVQELDVRKTTARVISSKAVDIDLNEVRSILGRKTVKALKKNLKERKTIAAATKKATVDNVALAREVKVLQRQIKRDSEPKKRWFGRKP